MVRWKYCIVLAMLLLLPTRTYSKTEEEDEEERGDEPEDDDDDEDDDEDDDVAEQKTEPSSQRRMAVPSSVSTSPPYQTITRTQQRPLECFVCAYKSETPIRACLDPAKFRVHTITCHSVDDRCFTSVISRGNTYEAVVRGCRSGCVGTPDTTCCELNRCNNQAFAMPIQLAQRSVLTSSSDVKPAEGKSNKSIPSTVLFFVTILLLLQTVVKVSFV